MARQTATTTAQDVQDAREVLLADLPVEERRHELAGISTPVLEGGSGPPLILLHGPGETALWWMRTIPMLVETHRVIIPDLPGHGASRIGGGAVDAERMFTWLDDLLDATAAEPPILVGHIVGGAIAARYAARRRRRISSLVLVDTLGLRRFRPAPGFAFGLMRFMARPSEENFDRFFTHCMHDPQDLATQMGPQWRPFVDYNMALSRDPEVKAAMGAVMKRFGLPRIPHAERARLPVSTGLIWGRGDRATPVHVAEAASKRYGWPLHVIEDTRDDPKLERPEEFVGALRSLIDLQERDRD